jgi:hypothetical protein
MWAGEMQDHEPPEQMKCPCGFLRKTQPSSQGPQHLYWSHPPIIFGVGCSSQMCLFTFIWSWELQKYTAPMKFLNIRKVLFSSHSKVQWIPPERLLCLEMHWGHTVTHSINLITVIFLFNEQRFINVQNILLSVYKAGLCYHGTMITCQIRNGNQNGIGILHTGLWHMVSLVLDMILVQFCNIHLPFHRIK